MNNYNGQKYLSRSVKSILKQDYSNWELIFWDNRSSDKSKVIIKKYKDKRIKLFFSKKHEKLYKARNLALSKAKGDFISFLDVDDTWQANKISTQINKIKNADICFSNYWINKKGNLKLFKKNLSSYKIKDQILNEYPIGILTVFMKSEIFKKKKLFFDSNYEIIGDFDFFYKLSKTFKFTCINKPLSTYYIHGNNLSIKKLKLEIKEFKNWIKINKKNLPKNNRLMENNNIRMCNYLYNNNRLSFLSSDLNKIDNFKIKMKFYIKIILQFILLK